MTFEDKMKSARRGLNFLKLGVILEPDMKRGLAVFAWLNWGLGVLFATFWFLVAKLLVMAFA
ncbi:hypothetical protein [Rhizobium sp. 18065]|uniref:hypothetical protein n=1 Tax=Rhizobium sp. 18065 TaxID=2681411 RepID=UPI0013578239|nr:hypothetical protein [Rhizobium sp. 18065]